MQEKRKRREGKLAMSWALGNQWLDDFWAAILLLFSWSHRALSSHPCGAHTALDVMTGPNHIPAAGQDCSELSKLHFKHSTNAARVLCWQWDSCTKGHLLLHPLSWEGRSKGGKRRSREKEKLILTTAAGSNSKPLTPLLLGKLTPKSLGVSLSLPLLPRVSLR